MFIDRKRLILIVIIIAVVAFLAWMMRPQRVPVDLVTVATGQLQVTLDEEGETRVRHRFLVSAPVPGRVLRIELEPGDAVTAEETILATFLGADPILLDARDRATSEARAKAAQAALGQAEAGLEQVRSEHAFATRELERQRAMVSQGIQAPRELEAAETDVDTRRDAVTAAEYAVGNARYELEAARAALIQAGTIESEDGDGLITIRSPVNGVVLQRFRESEAVVPAGEPLLAIGDPARLEIVADFLSTDAVRMAPGQQVIIDQWGEQEPLAGRVRRVEPFGFTKISALGVEEQRVNVIVDFADARERWEALGDGYRVEVRVVVWSAEDVLVVPTSSLFRHDGAWEVFVAEGGRAHRVEIAIGERNGLQAEVLEGLTAGQQVVAYPSDAVVDGIRIVERD